MISTFSEYCTLPENQSIDFKMLCNYCPAHLPGDHEEHAVPGRDEAQLEVRGPHIAPAGGRRVPAGVHRAAVAGLLRLSHCRHHSQEHSILHEQFLDAIDRYKSVLQKYNTS